MGIDRNRDFLIEKKKNNSPEWEWAKGPGKVCGSKAQAKEHLYPR